MKLTLSLVVCFAVAAVPCLSALGAPQPASLVQEDTAAKFSKAFNDALRLGDAAQMAQVVKRYQNDAVVRIEDVCTRISEGNSEELEREIQALIVAWRSSMKGEFPARYYEYLSLISPPEKRERQRITYEYHTALRKYFGNLEKKVGTTFEVLADEFEAYAKAFTSIGDQYMAAQSWMNYAYCFEDDVRSRKDRSPKKVIIGFTNAVAAMDRIDLKYARYFQAKERAETLAGEGWQAVIDDPDAPEPGEPAVKGDPVSVEMTFEALEKMTAFQRPNYFVDDIYQMWPSMDFLNSRNAEATIPGIKGSPRILRREQASLEIHSDGDGRSDATFKITGNSAVVETEIQEGGQRGWAFLGATGVAGDTYQGQQLNLAPAEYLRLFYINAASVVGVLGDEPFRVIDDNTDGVYASNPGHWQYLGLSKDLSQPTFDSIVIGKKSKRALPWSLNQRFGEDWYRMVGEEGGMRILATPMDLETGSIKLAFKGPTPSWVIIAGLEALEGSYFDLLQNGKGKPVVVPAGNYMLKVGEVRKGKKLQVMKALILPGEETPVWNVVPGKETVVQLGAPFGFDFKHSTSDSGVTVVGHSVIIIGAADERYERAWNCVPDPTMSVREVGAKRGTKPQQMEQVLDFLEMQDGRQKYVYADLWHPLNFTIKARGEIFEVQLVEKKNKLFGKIESDWR